MANALARTQDIYGNGDGAMLVLAVVYSGPDVVSPMTATVAVSLVGTESAVQLRGLMSAAVSAWPVNNGQSWTVAGGSMNLPTFQKG
jgi:hypothetical protein